MSQWHVYLVLLLSFKCVDLYGQSRLESEFKLSIPQQDIKFVQLFFEEEFVLGTYTLDSINLSVDKADELFVDTYFDDTKSSLLHQNIGLRHRLRYNQDVLINELVQLKLPGSTNGVIRQEIKYKVPKNVNVLDQISRHPVLQFVAATERDQFSYEMRKWNVDVQELREQLKLTQNRKRIYLNDEMGSVATISLDHVMNKKIPFQEFYELEIEINEIRYTEADEDERKYLNTINQLIKQNVMSRFPTLSVDQTPKYNKLQSLIKESLVSKIVDKGMWMVYGVVLCLAVAKLIWL